MLTRASSHLLIIAQNALFVKRKSCNFSPQFFPGNAARKTCTAQTLCGTPSLFLQAQNSLLSFIYIYLIRKYLFLLYLGQVHFLNQLS